MTSRAPLEAVRTQVLEALARDSSQDVVVAFIEVLLTDSRKSLLALTEAARRGDLAACESLAHRCKSSFGSAGADGLHHALEELESDILATRIPADALPARVAPLVSAFDDVERALRAWVQTQARP